MVLIKIKPGAVVVLPVGVTVISFAAGALDNPCVIGTAVLPLRIELAPEFSVMKPKLSRMIRVVDGVVLSLMAAVVLPSKLFP